MPATSPYQNNDYNAASAFRPYQLPVNDIAQASQALDYYWKLGAERVKHVYESALDLDLTTNENIEIRKNFLNQAQQQLTKLSAMDLSDPSVQRQGLSIFQPLFQDKGILMDDYLTKRRNQVISDAQKAKMDPKTKGEGFNQDNLTYALLPFQNFNQDTSRADLPNIFQNARDAQYTPYHDVSKEMLDIAAKCKPDDITSTSVQGLYLHTIQDASMNASKLNACIQSGLSSKAWNQMLITGTVRYGNDVPTIAKGYQSVLQGDNQAYAQKILDMSALRKQLDDSKQLTPDVAKDIDDNIATIKSQMAENGVISQKITAGDYSDVQKDLPNIIAKTWGTQEIGGFSAAWAHKQYAEKYAANAAGIAQYREGEADARANARLQYDMQKDKRDYDLNLMKTLLGTATGSGSATYQMLAPYLKGLGYEPNIPEMLNTGVVVQNDSHMYDTVKAQIDEFQHDRTQSASKMLNAMEAVDPDAKDALEKLVRNSKGEIDGEALLQKANNYINDYYKDPSKFSSTSQEMQDLEAAANEYSMNSTKVGTLIKERDEMDAKINASPELKAAKAEADNTLAGYIQNDKKAVMGYDPSTKKAVILYPEDLAAMAKGTNSQYAFDSHGRVIIKATGQLLEANGPKLFENAGSGFFQSKWKDGDFQVRPGYSTYDLEKNSINAYSQLSKYWGVKKDIENKVEKPLTDIVNTVVRNSTMANANNLPGFENSLKQELSFIPDIGNGSYTVQGGLSKTDKDGDYVTRVFVTKAGIDPNTGKPAKNAGTVDDKDVIKAINAQRASTNGTFDNIKIEDGQVWVKTPYLPTAPANYPLKDAVDDMVYMATKQPIEAGRVVSQQVQRAEGTGFTMGFDIIGGGTDYSGRARPNTYRAWMQDPSGKKTYSNPVYQSSQISNQLYSIQAQIKSYASAYYSKQKDNSQ